MLYYCCLIRVLFTVPSRLQGSILRPTSAVYPTPVQNGPEFFSTQSINQLTKTTIPKRFQTEKSGRKQKALLNTVWSVLIHNPACDKSVFDAFFGDFFHSKA